MNNRSLYLRFTRFLIPLIITLIVVELGGQVISAGLARVPQATETLAAYGVAWGLVVLFTSPLTHARALGLVLVEGEPSRRLVKRFVVGVALCAMVGLAILVLTPISSLVIESWHGVSTMLGDTVRTCIFWLIPVPLLKGLSAFYTGLLIRHRRTDLVSYANMTGTGAGIAVVIFSLPTNFIQTHPIWLPILATYVNLLTELTIVYFGQFWSGINKSMPSVLNDAPSPSTPSLTLLSIVRFFWPLAFVILAQEFSRPLINIYVASRSPGPEALAVLTVAYVLGQFPYRWLNDIRSLATAFQTEPDNLRYIVRFAVGCGFVSLAMMLILFWTPLRDYILLTLMGLSPDLAAQCRAPLMIFAAFPAVVTLRAYSQGIAFVEKRTQVLAMGAPPRLAATWLTLMLLPYFAIEGAALGVAALFAGFLVEAPTLWWGVRGQQWFKAKRLALAASTVVK